MRSALAVLLLMAAPAFGQGDAALRPKLEALAKTGNAEALYHLGMLYQVGAGGVSIDHQRALGYFRRAAAAGDPLGAYKLGCFYAGQDDVLAPDEDKALHYKLVAATAGYALAQQDVAAIYAGQGKGAAAEEWIVKAVAQGVPGALFGYASLRNGKNGLPRDGAIVVAYFTLFLATQDGAADQQRWLDQQRDALSPGDRARAERIVADFTPKPSLLTIKALSGQRAAEQLVRAGK